MGRTKRGTPLERLREELREQNRMPWAESRLKDRDELPHFTCPKCGRTSWNPTDARERYCGACQEFFPEG
jgi:hypothetical protein